MKTAVAAVCVVAAGMGGFKAYNTENQSQADMLLAENVRGAKRNVVMECESLKSVKALETKELGGVEAWRG